MPRRDVVDGMAECVDARMKQLRLTPGEFARAAGLTPQALEPVRAGIVKQYQSKTIYGVAAALRWETDWYDRLLHGKQPIELTDGADDATEVAELRAEVAALRALVLRHLGSGPDDAQ